MIRINSVNDAHALATRYAVRYVEGCTTFADTGWHRQVRSDGRSWLSYGPGRDWTNHGTDLDAAMRRAFTD